MSQIVVVTSRDRESPVNSALQDTGFTTTVVPDTEGFRSLPPQEAPDAVIVDYSSVAVADGAEVVDECRKRRLPVLALVPNGALGDYDFTRSGDDFVTLPCAPQEIITRVRQLLWKTRPKNRTEVLKFGDLQIHLERYEVSVRGRPVLLTYKEYQLLLFLASAPGRVYSRETLLSRIWGYDYIGGTRTVDVHVRRLRSKLGEGQDSFVETVWNVGYRFRSTDGQTPSGEGSLR
ncbi:MAG: response regulator transcription factor [Dehalococcoidia bacterium]|nr:response regulator transcription factor [Dehalococcoidia bacterium]